MSINIDFSKENGLVPAIVQDVENGKVLMVAYVNQEAFDYTIKSGKATFWSRSRNKIWCKGEESGNFMEIADIRIDCDEDCLLYLVNPKGNGAACHTGYVTCFYRSYKDGNWQMGDEEKRFDPDEVYKK